jgi:hypothetical protein
MCKQAWFSAICLGPPCWLLVVLMVWGVSSGSVLVRKRAFSDQQAREALSHQSSMIVMNRMRVRLWL